MLIKSVFNANKNHKIKLYSTYNWSNLDNDLKVFAINMLILFMCKVLKQQEF